MLGSLLCYPNVGSEAYLSPSTPLSVLAVASALVEAGQAVRICDQRVVDDWRAELDSALTDPDLVCVGLSAMSGPQVTHALEMAEHIRSKRPELPLVWGGVHPSLLPEQTLQSDLVDVVVIGEGEGTFPELVAALAGGRGAAGVAGCASLDADGAYRREPDRPFLVPDDLPVLRFDLLDHSRYHGNDGPHVEKGISIQTSRGCPGTCTYCYNTAFHKHQWRGLSAGRVIVELQDLSAKGFRDIYLTDEFFFCDMDRARIICRALIDDKIRLRFQYANCRVDRAARFRDEDLALFREAGIELLFLGVESGSPRMLRAIHKGHTPEGVREVVTRLTSAGLRVQLSFMLGLPGESVDDIQQTLAHMEELVRVPGAVVPGCGHFLPFPGTPLHDVAVQAGWVPPASLQAWGHITEATPCAWLGESVGRVARQAAFVSSALDTSINPRSNVVLETLRKCYSRFARLRARRGWVRCVPEFLLMQTVLRRLLASKRKS